ncbi:MAG: hypothetical protein WC375_10375 [Methanomassiliicoccales archaeon]
MKGHDDPNPSQGGTIVMLELALPYIMMSSVDPKYLRTCQRTVGHSDDDILLKRELSGAAPMVATARSTPGPKDRRPPNRSLFWKVPHLR